jgi:hypothetical protein
MVKRKMSSKKRLFYDIETSFCKGHFWRPGWNQNIQPHQITEYAKIISIHWKWGQDGKVQNMHWGLKKQCDKKLVARFIEEMNKADEIITHNGKRFDTPWIRTRAMFHNIDMNHTYNELDTYKLCKKYLNLPSNSLAEACKYFGLTAKKDPGGIQTWIDIVYKKDRKALDHLLYYGDGDVESLAELFNKLKKYVRPNMHYAVLGGFGKFHCPECGKLGIYDKKYTTAHGTVQHYMKCKGSKDRCGTTWKINNKTYVDFLKYKMENGLKL